MIILGIETSCDETAAAILEAKNDKIKILSNIISSQIEIHKKYGGVVPEVAAREHVLNILPVINEALIKAGINPQQPTTTSKKYKKIDAIAVTTGPGLITSLISGVETAKTLSFAWDVPIIPVNHIAGHIYANFIDKQPSQIKFPAIVLTVSGGHTLLVLMKGYGKLKTIGETRDDAAGEAFDKAAQLLNIGYPGGPAIAAHAIKIENRKSYIENPVLPRPMINDKSLDFSFSGLKTALLYQIRNDKKWKNKIPEYAHEFQQAIIDVLISKTIKATKQYKVKTVMLSGGVAANQELREQLKNSITSQLPLVDFYIPDLKYCTDNAPMIAAAGYYLAKRKKFLPWQKLKADSNLELI